MAFHHLTLQHLGLVAFEEGCFAYEEKMASMKKWIPKLPWAVFSHYWQYGNVGHASVYRIEGREYVSTWACRELLDITVSQYNILLEKGVLVEKEARMKVVRTDKEHAPTGTLLLLILREEVWHLMQVHG